MKLISKGIFGKYSKIKISFLNCLKKGIFLGFFKHSILNENVVKNFKSRTFVYAYVYIQAG